MELALDLDARRSAAGSCRRRAAWPPRRRRRPPRRAAAGGRPSTACAPRPWRSCATSSVPMRSPAARRSSTSGSRPEAMTVLAPLRAARLAASTLVSMPPRPMRASRRRRPCARAPGRRRGRARRGAPAGSLRGSAEKRPAWSVRITQRVGIEQVGDQRAERVVVAELDLVVDDRVVLVDDRHDAQAEQRHQRRARVEVALAIGQVGVGEQHLRAADAVLAQRRSRRSAPGPSGRRRPRPAARARRCGRAVQPRRFMPSAMAPLETITSSRPVCAPARPSGGTSRRWPRRRRRGLRW